jgi:UDP-glucose 4-epimerase
MNILICGGAGYIGSHMIKLLEETTPHKLILVDNFSTGRFKPSCKCYHKDVLDQESMVEILNTEKIELVMHFAALSLVSESMVEPAKYYVNNVVGSIQLLEAMRKSGVKKLVFSSTAAVYGAPSTALITEADHTKPTNVYGNTKLAAEKIIEDYCNAYKFDAVIFRYFNAAGAHHSGEIGEAHDPETHLIPNILKLLATPEPRTPITIYGDNYDTPDGSCIRDYVHVTDICQAHSLAINFLSNARGCHVYNLSNGKGFSVFEILRACESITGLEVPFVVGGRRPGDPDKLVASSEKVMGALGWKPQISEIEDIIRSAWKFHRNHSKN